MTDVWSAAGNGKIAALKKIVLEGANLNELKNGKTPLHRAAANGQLKCVKLLLKSGANVDLVDNNEVSPLYSAAADGHTDCVKLLLEGGANADLANQDGWTPLYIAAANDHSECVKLLVSGGAKVDIANKNGWSPLYRAAVQGHVDLVKLFLEAGANADLADKNGFTALYMAAANGHPDCVRVLLKAAAKVESTKVTPLHGAATNGHVNCLNLLLEGCTNANPVDVDGETPLYRAAANGHADCVHLLSVSGASVDLADKEGSTPLHKATEKGLMDCMKKLLDCGANIDRVTKDGETLLYWAAANGLVGRMKLLLERGASVNLTDKDGETALYRAAANGQSECVKMLVAVGANVELSDTAGVTPLFCAVANGRWDCVKLLLEGGANVNLADKDGNTPLYCAAANGKVDCMQLLVDGGANFDTANKYGVTPLYCAAANGHVDGMKLLVTAGANVHLADKDGFTPLHRVSMNCQVEGLKLLLTRGAIANPVSKSGKTPLGIALSEKYLECAVNVIAHGAKANYRTSLLFSSPYTCRDKQGRNLLHVAVESRVSKAVLPIIQAFPKSVDGRDNDGNTPLDVAIQCDSEISVLWLLYCHQNDVRNHLREAHPLLFNATRMTNRTIQSVHIHLVGHGYAGKTTCRLALNKSLKYLNSLKFALFGNREDVSVDRSNGSGKTEGMEMDSIESTAHKWLIRDYGGQEDFHVNHARFLSIPGSIYVIVVALWDAERYNNALVEAKKQGGSSPVNEKLFRFSVEEVKNRYVYWLKFLNSIAEEGNAMNCVTVVNFAAKVDKQFAEEAIRAIKQCCTDWKSSNSTVKLFGDPLVLSANKVNEVRQLNDLLKACADSSKDENSISVLNYVNAIDNSFEAVVGGKHSKLTRLSEFKATVCIPAVHSLVAAKSPESIVQHVDFVCDKMIEYLCASGKIINVPTSTSTDPLIVLDVNWLSKELLGSLISKMSEPGNMNYILTEGEIDSFTNGGSKYFDGVDGLVSFLESIGACVATHTSNTSAKVVKRWFPLLSQTKFNSGEECVPIKFTGGGMNTFRKVVRMFKLSDPGHQMFPPGYFLNLFLKVVSLFSIGSARTVKVFINGLEIEYHLSGAVLQALLTVADDRNSFLVTVSSSDNLTSKSAPTGCWKTFLEIRDVIMNVTDEQDMSLVSPWFNNVILTEVFVDPINTASVKNRDAVALLDESLRNLFFYGCDERNASVNELEPRIHLLIGLMNKIDSAHERLDKVESDIKILNDKWNNITVSLASEIAQEAIQSFQTILDQEVRTRILSSMNKVNRDTVTMDELHGVIETLRTELINKSNTDNSQVLSKLDKVQESVNNLSSEVKLIKQLDEPAIQEAVVKAMESSKTLQRIDNMFQTVMKGTHDVPTMAIVIPVVVNAALLTLFDPNNWITNEYSLHFVCSHSHQVVPCGPDGKGYRFKRAQKWFKKVAPVIKVCLIAAKIALTISGIPIPIHGMVDSLDQITVVAETTKYLNTSLSVVDRANNVVSKLGVNLGDQGSGVDDAAVDDAEQYVKSLDGLLKQSDTLEAYKALKALLEKEDPNLDFVGLEKVTSESGKTGWVKKGDQAVKDSFMRDEKWPMKIEKLKESYNDVTKASAEGQSTLGARVGLFLPKSLFGKS